MRTTFQIVDKTILQPTEKILELEELNLSNLWKYIGDLETNEKNTRKGIDFLAKYGIIHNERKTRTKSTPMSLVKDKTRIDGLLWRCKNEHKKLSIRDGSYLSESKLSVQQNIYLASNFLENYDKEPEDVAKEMKMSTPTLLLYYNQYRDYCRIWCRKNIMRQSKKVGGRGIVVEMDETVLGINSEPQFWVFGLVQQGTDKVAMFEIESTAKGRLFPLLVEHIEEDSIVITDCWNSYRTIEDLQEEYNRFAPNHRIHFMHFNDNLAKIKTEDANWDSLRTSFKLYQDLPKHKMSGYMFHYMFHRRLNGQKLLNNLLVEMGELYEYSE